MSEVIGKKGSLAIAAACFSLGVYCLQFVFLLHGIELPGVYVGSLLLFMGMVLVNFQGARFEGLNILPPNRLLIIVFWGVLLFLLCAYFVIPGRATYVTHSRPAHFVVGLGLLVFFGLSFFGSFFSGFGAYLFIRNPVTWAIYLVSRRDQR